MNKPAEVLVVGDVMRDIIVRPDGAIRRGSDVDARIETLPGGSAANQAKWLGHIDVGVQLLARVGAGDVDVLTAALAEYGVEACLAGDQEAPTGTLVNLVEPDGERSFFTDGGANRHLCMDDVQGKLTSNIRLLLMSGYGFFAPGPRAALQALADEARGVGAFVAVDAASAGYLKDVGVPAFLDWVSGADILFANDEEAGLLAGNAGSQFRPDPLLGHFSTVIIKHGRGGATGYTRAGEKVDAAARPVEVVDTTGAGDAFAAGFIGAWLQDAPLQTCVALGNEKGAEAVQILGGAPRRAGK